MAPTSRPPRWPRGLAAILGVAGVVLAALAVWSYRVVREQARESVERELNAIIELKTRQIAEWRRERLADAHLIHATPYAARRALDALAQPQDPATRQMFTAWLDRLMANGPYTRALLLDEQLEVRLVHPPAFRLSAARSCGRRWKQPAAPSNPGWPICTVTRKTRPSTWGWWCPWSSAVNRQVTACPPPDGPPHRKTAPPPCSPWT
ncbi:MAG: hypothetical protein M5U12_24120 [Verrucomicrobia bacterium]|nr:hypothetical protein [Verrucomicrobiota bacterium]